MTETHNCPDCKFKKKYDDNPKSFLGRVWRWHATFCPGWNGYMKSLDEKTRKELAELYQFKKYM